ncbi:FxSxx-COOH system tetratricopeptide repeat protein [Paractinoplanes hotanensis]|uniref:FxSxx-COOH system tetratricopeptide repeat protein n=1 Tax=Paractinoplanes hotanensis TaxID=2906497 RepID=A0ABT0Y298_9ACTN|nr:FxSxx-COOH system tetratricopeptide repeat protein [Actinoplanes hotanensis]MCM4080158.1 FxSxx-COOH system tetratricopeptide repeat protein [Actinoplanes hotanensis]
MTDGRDGKVVTFYSYKGGTGRTMALANVAWILAANGKRVLVADWDLESPGLHRFFRPFIDPEALAGSGGVIELVRGYEQATLQDVERDDDWHRDYARVSRHAFTIGWDRFPDGGTLDFLAAGSQNQDYARSVYERDWDEFYERLGGGQLFDALRDDMKRHYDYALIDSRTGWSDVAGICTVHMPDVLIDCFTFSEQGIDGAATVAANVSSQQGRRQIRILPVPMRVDLAELKRADAGRVAARQRFTGLPGGMSTAERDAYWSTVEVPYVPFYAYEETLATFGDRPGSRSSMLAAYETLTGYITGGEITSLPPMEESLRERTAARFVRPTILPESTIALRYAPDDRVWAEWIGKVLETAGVTVNAVAVDPDADNARTPAGRVLTVVSAANALAERARVPRDRSDPRTPLVAYVSDVSALRGQPESDSAFLSGQAEEVAVTRLLRLVGHPVDDFDRSRIGLRYPGRSTVLFNAPIRNVQFTGREKDLQDLRAKLLASGSPVVLSGASPVALQGMGGIGKTQVAMEYAHRFRNAYDFVWWIDADPVTFVDTQLSDLARELGLAPDGGIADQAQAVLSALRRGRTLSRWLVIFDNAEDIAVVSRFLPSGPGGHVIVTSRDAGWGEHAQTVPVDVFDRRESIAHLRRRVPSLRADDASRLAELLGDLPIAVAAAGAWLADTGAPVEDYLRHIDQYGPANLESVWDLSLKRLEERSAAAYRLLTLCSVLAPQIALDLIYSDRMADLLRPLDPMVTDAMYRGSLIQQINRLALLKLDVGGGQIHVHRIVQHVVRQRMTPEQIEEARRQVHLVLAAARPTGEVDDPENWPRFRQLWPHLEVSRAYLSREEPVRRLIIDRVRYVWQSGGYNDGRRLAEEYVRRWTELRDQLTDPAERDSLSRQLLYLRFNLGNIVRDRADFAEARALDEQVLTEQRDLLGETHPHTLTTAGGLGASLRALGLYADALRLDERTTAAWVENFGEDQLRTMMAMNNLASSLRLSGRVREARDRERRLYERCTLVLGENHILTLQVGNNYGRDLREAGEYVESITLLQDVLARHRRAFGDNAPKTYSTMTNLAVSERSAGRTREAANRLDLAYDNLNRLLGPDGPETLACRLSRAVNLLATGEPDTAGDEMARVERSYRTRLGASHPHTLTCLNNRATVARALSDLGTARRLAREAAEGFDRRLGRDHPYTLAARMNLAIFTAEWGAVPDAYDMIVPVVAGIERLLGHSHPDTARAEVNLSLIKADVEGHDPAVEREAVRRLRDLLGDNHPAVEALREGRYVHRTLDPHPF